MIPSLLLSFVLAGAAAAAQDEPRVVSIPSVFRDETPAPESPDRVRVRLRPDGAGLEVELTRTLRFADSDALLRWMREEGRDFAVVLEAGKHTEYGSIAELFEGLRALGVTKIELSLSDPHEDYLDRVRQRMEEDPFLQGTWLGEYYTKEFGDRAASVMWKDLDRAMREQRLWLALNLLENLPTVDGTYYAVRPEGAAVSDEAVRGYLTALRDAAAKGGPGQMAVDPLARIVERRAVQFLLDYANDTELPFWDRQSAWRALMRIRLYEKVRRGEASSNWVISPKDDEASRARFDRSLAELGGWWATAKSEYPAQVLPAPSGDR